jgi:putative molybdopterin biosynthesis protein
LKRNVYLNAIALNEAKARFFKELDRHGIGTVDADEIPVTEALGRVTAEAVFAKVSSPHYPASAMDGISVKAVDTWGATEVNPIRLVRGKQFKDVDTGDPLTESHDAVIMVEDLHFIDKDTVEITAAVSPGQHVRPIGEDIVASELIIPENHRIRPVDVGAVLTGGVTNIKVRKKPIVAIIPTGTELVPPGSELKPGDIIESNSSVFKGLVEELGGEAHVLPIMPDDYEGILKAVDSAVDASDVVIINAGSSAGSEDYTSAVIKRLGELLVHGVAIRPGKPVVLGIVRGKPVVGLPGYPVSAILNFELFVRPLLFRLLGLYDFGRETIEGVIARKTPSPIGSDEFLRVKVGLVNGKMIATPISRGAGVITSLVRADGVVRVPSGSEGFAAGDKVNIQLFRTHQEIQNTIVVIGSHDISIDIIGNLLKKKYPHITVSSAHVGSMGGIMALKRGEAHLAGVHMLDPETGDYNHSYIKRYLPNRDIHLISLAGRDQGLMVARTNPKGIYSIDDLIKQDVRFVNRQRGAGTRMLLDFELSKRGISPDQIQGYSHEEFTHLAVAAAVAGGSADAGMGILAAANALNLDFISVSLERYDLAIPAEFLELDIIKRMLEIIRSEEFKAELEALGGYHTEFTGVEMEVVG